MTTTDGKTPALTGAERQKRLRARRGPPLKFYLDQTTRAELQRLASAQRRSVASLVRAALVLYLAHRGTKSASTAGA